MTDSTYTWDGGAHSRRMTELAESIRRDARTTTPLAQARYLGADAALAATASLTMSESDAVDFLDGDGSHDLRERYLSDELPSLAEWEDACNETLASQAGATGWTTDDSLAAAWEEGRDAVWSDAVTAFACRITGDIPRALSIEASNESYVDSLRSAAR